MIKEFEHLYIDPDEPNGHKRVILIGLLVAAIVATLFMGSFLIVTSRDWSSYTVAALLAATVTGLLWSMVRKSRRQDPHIPTYPPQQASTAIWHGPAGEAQDRSSPTYVFGDTPAVEERSPDDNITAKHYWMMLVLPAFVAVLSFVALIMVAMQSEDDFKMTLAIFMLVAFGLMVGIPYVTAVYRAFKQVRQIGKLTLIVRIGGIAGVLLFVGMVVYMLHREGVSFQWVGDLAISIGSSIIDLMKVIVSSPESLMVTTVVLALVKLMFQFIDWRINPLVLDGDLLTEHSGIFRRKPAQVKISKITDLTSVGWEKVPWVRAIIETSGQDQALTDIHWMPRWFFTELENRWNGQRDE